MDELNALLHGFSTVLSWYNIGMMLIGLVLGVIIGVLPGLGGPNGVAILLPLTFTMPPTSAGWCFGNDLCGPRQRRRA